MAKNFVVKKWELLKVCKEIVEENDNLVANMNFKEKLKENILYEADERKLFEEWKSRNMRYLNLKESSRKENTNRGLFEVFCKEKGLERKKDNWELEASNENKKVTEIVKEIKIERTAAKSKKKKLVLFRKCLENLKKIFEDEKSTPAAEEDRKFRSLKEKAKKEKIVKELGRSKLKQIEEENQRRMKTTLPDKPIPQEAKLDSDSCPTITFDVVPRGDLGCDNPIVPFPATDSVEMSIFKITKPQPSSDSTAAEAPVTSSPHQPGPPIRNEMQVVGPIGWSEREQARE